MLTSKLCCYLRDVTFNKKRQRFPSLTSPYSTVPKLKWQIYLVAPGFKNTTTVLSKFDSDYHLISETHIHSTASGRSEWGKQGRRVPMLDYVTATNGHSFGCHPCLRVPCMCRCNWNQNKPGPHCISCTNYIHVRQCLSNSLLSNLRHWHLQTSSKDGKFLRFDWMEYVVVRVVSSGASDTGRCQRHVYCRRAPHGLISTPVDLIRWFPRYVQKTSDSGWGPST